MQATTQLQELWTGLSDEMITKLTNTMNEAGIKVPVPVILMSEVGEEYKSKVFELDGRKFKLPLSNSDRAELRNLMVKRAKGDYEIEPANLPKNCGSAQIIAHFN